MSSGASRADGAASPAEQERSRLLSAGALMASGTVVSRLTGFLRAALILAALGKSLDADLFTLANTLPNSLYILVAGGVFNVVLVPQLVRAMRADPDGGQAFAQRILSLGVLVLAGATAVLLIAVPLLARIAFPASLFGDDLTVQRESAYNLMRFCMPQVFFYGVFVLVGQMLNARQRFGPMMWAPIVNNAVGCAVLGGYLAAYGASDGSDGFTTSQEALLGIGSTLGIAVQTAVLIPFVRASGLRLRLRFDLRGVGLGRTIRLGVWTLLFVIVNQLAFVIVSRIAVGSATDAALGRGEAAGATVYQNAFLIVQVPHAIITVSLVTATMPLLSRLAADRELKRVRDEIVATLRLVLSLVVPIAVALACLGQPIAAVLFSHGALRGGTGVIGATIVAFAPGLVFFTVHYLLLRGFYADEDTRTPFLIQTVLCATNIGGAVLFTWSAPPARVAMLLALAYAAAYLVGALLSSAMLSRRVGTLFDASLGRFLGRVGVAAGVAAAGMLAVSRGLQSADVSVDSAGSAAVVLSVAGCVGAVSYLLAGRLLRIGEVGALLALLRRR
ncbi:MAG: murein biosynthesis integral membrane protein MurJ [Nocardioidaceae bacterium]|nr:murein biosynthesis integral membrane protein MurJ [Nocardioidaceae bacterium]